TPAKSPLLKKSIHFAFTVSISAFWANAGIISPTTKAIASAIVRMTHDSCDVTLAPYAVDTRPMLPSALRRENDTEYNALVRTHLSRSADVSATIGRDHVIDLVVGNRRPNTVHFNFVVIANDATLGRPTINQIAARTSVVSSELRVEALMPFIVARPVVSLLRRSVQTKKQGSRPAECGQQFPPSDGDCHTPLPCEVRKGNDTTPRACCPNSAAPGAGNTVPSRTVNVLAVFTPNDGSSPMGLPFVPPLAAFEYGGVRNLEHSGDGPNAKPLLS